MANYGPQINSDLLPVSTVLLEHGRAHSFMGCFWLIWMAELSSCDRDYTACKEYTIYDLALYRKKFAEPCHRPWGAREES